MTTMQGKPSCRTIGAESDGKLDESVRWISSWLQLIDNRINPKIQQVNTSKYNNNITSNPIKSSTSLFPLITA
jgi:hypothetical protein